MGNKEYSPEIRDTQTGSTLDNVNASDLIAVSGATQAAGQAPLGEPPPNYDVRATFDSRFVNAYDFNMSTSAPATSAAPWVIEFTVPLGYRAIPRRWEVIYQGITGPISPADSTVTLQSNGVSLPYNGPIIIGSGGTVRSFFLCEEGSTFGMTGFNGDAPSSNVTVSINVYGNLIPTSDVQLPYMAANRIPGT